MSNEIMSALALTLGIEKPDVISLYFFILLQRSDITWFKINH